MSKEENNQNSSKTIQIPEKYIDPSINIALDTIAKNKQALFFVSTKSSAEKLAEEIAHKIKDYKQDELAKKILKVLPKPTSQCRRLSLCVAKGTAFHHAGLHAKQREIVEEEFKKGTIKIICSTPTLAAGVDLPAFRAVIRDLKRFSQWGMQPIPVLEYQQMAGRAGRPSFDSYGEAITIAKAESDIEEIASNFIHAPPEQLYSKLAVEPVLRTYLLSLIASRYVKSRNEITEFFKKTFWAYQYKDMNKLTQIIDKMIELLEEWEFIKKAQDKNNQNVQRISEKMTVQKKKIQFSSDEFISATEMIQTSKSKSATEISNNNSNNADNIYYIPTSIGKRVAELYLDPYTAHELIEAMNRGKESELVLFSFLQMLSNTLEMRPLLKVKTKEYDEIMNAVVKHNSHLLFAEPSAYDLGYDDYLASIKTALFMQEWCEEKDDEYLLEKYNIRPGEVRAKLERADWLCYASIELARLLSFNSITSDLLKTRIRLKYGVREELLPLMKLKGIGRVRARKLFNNNLKTIGDIKNASITTLTQLLGKAVAENLHEQTGDEAPEEISEYKRKGQMSLSKYHEE